MTLVATAMSVGAYAQETEASDGAINKYFRIINAGYLADPDFQTGVMYISEPTTAQPQKTKDEAVTLPGTVMWLNAVPISEIPGEIGKYEDVSENDLEVINLRSQGVDAQEAIYGPLVKLLRLGFTGALLDLNIQNKWGFSSDEQAQIIDEMFDLMKMFLEPAGDVDGEDTWYLKSTTPNTQPLVDALKEKGLEVDCEGLEPSKWAWKRLTQGALTYFLNQGDMQLYEQWYHYVYYEDRIHIGHTYYLIGGRVETDLATYQRHDKGPKKGEYISFANNNKFYTFIDENTGETAKPEIEVANAAGNFAKWFLREVVTKKEAIEDKALDYFAVEGAVLGGNFEEDGKQHWYTTIYTDFPMDIIPNDDNETVKVWGIVGEPEVLNGYDFNGEAVAGYVKAKEITGTIPARTPVVIECVNSDRESNPLLPSFTPKSGPNGESFLKGIFFEEFFDVSDNEDDEVFTYHYMPLEQGEPYARKLVRVFNRSNNNTNNPMGFYKYKGKSIKPNKAFMTLNEDMAKANIFILDEETYDALGISEVATTTTENATIYDIQGRVVNNPTKGVYIVNGKKMVIK